MDPNKNAVPPAEPLPQQTTPLEPNYPISGPGVVIGTSGVGVGTGIQLGRRQSAVFCILFGLVFVGIGLFVYKTSQIPASYVSTTGHVVQEATVYESRMVNGYQQQVLSYAPVIQFTAQGQSYSFQSSSSSNPPAFNVGQSVEVAYNPANPGSAPKNASDKTAGFLGPIFAAVGAIIIVIGAFLAIKRSA